MKAQSNLRQATIEAVVIRADGSKEDLGVVSYWHKNPVRRLLWRLKIRRLLRRIRRNDGDLRR